MTRFVHLPPAPLKRVLAAVADARMKYKDEIDRARRTGTRRTAAIRARQGEVSLTFSESRGCGRAATERSCLPILLACPRGQPVPPTFQRIREGTAFIPPPSSPAPR